MTNIELNRKGDILTVTIDLSKESGRSKSGKTITVASTQGNKKVPDADDTFIGVNVYRKP